MNVHAVLESMEPIIREELGHHSDRDLDRVRRWLDRELQHHAFLRHIAAAAEEASKQVEAPQWYGKREIAEIVYGALDVRIGDLEHRHIVGHLDDVGLLEPTLRLAEIAMDHLDGKPLDRATIRKDLHNVNRERSIRHLRVAGPST